MDRIEIIDMYPEERDPRALLKNDEPSADPKISVLLRMYKAKPKIQQILKEVANSLLDEIAEKNSTNRHKPRGNKDSRLEAMTFIILNMLMSWSRLDTESEGKCEFIRPCVAYSRNKNFYSKDYMMRKYRIRYKPMIEAADGLESLGYIECFKGFYDKEKKNGYTSRMRVKARLVELMLKKNIDRDCVVNEFPRLIEMKAKAEGKAKIKKSVDVSKHPKTIKLEPDVFRVNEMLENANVTLSITRVERIDMILHNKNKENENNEISTITLPNPNQNKVRRIFNNRKFDNGGRFYGHWVQSIPRRLRGGDHLFINGSPAVELDFKEFHIRMLYCLRKCPLPDHSPYDLERWAADSYRKAIKLITNTLINADDEKSATDSIMHGGKQKKSVIAIDYNLSLNDVQNIISAIKQKHHAIAADLHSGVGVKLQFIDSEIARRVMLSLWDKGISCVPLHDSFIVAKEHAAELEKALHAESSRELGKPIPVDVKNGGEHYSLQLTENNDSDLVENLTYKINMLPC